MDASFEDKEVKNSSRFGRAWSVLKLFFAFMKAEDDLDPDGATLRWWRRRIDDLLKASKYLFGGLTFTIGLSFTVLLSGKTPYLLYAAEMVFIHTIDAMVYTVCGVFFLYLFKIADITNVYSPRKSALSKALQVKHLIFSVAMFFMIAGGAGWALGTPLLAVYQARVAVPEIARVLRCEAEHSNSLQYRNYVPSVECWETIDELNSPARIASRPKEKTPYVGE